MRKKLFATVLIILILGMSTLIVVGCNKEQKTDWEYIQDKGNIVVGYFDFEPFAYARGDVKGVEVDIIKAIGEKLGLKVTFQKISTDEIKANLDDKTVDVIVGGLPNASVFTEGIGVSKSYLHNRQVAVIKKSDSMSLNSKDKIAKAKIVAWEGGESVSIIKSQFVGASVTYVENSTKALQSVMSGDLDVAIVGDCYAAYNLGMAYYSDLQIVDGLQWGGQDIVMGTRESDTGWIAKLDETLKTLSIEGKLREIAKIYNLEDQVKF